MPAASPNALSHNSPTVGIRDRFGHLVGLSCDQFGRLRVSQPQSLAALKQIDLAAEFTVAGSALDAGSTSVYNVATSSTTITATVDGNRAVYQSARRYNYEAAKSQLAFITGLSALGSASSGAETAFMRMGQFDYDQGAYWEVTSSGGTWNNYLCIRSTTGAAERVPQSSWNLDRLDGGRRFYNPSEYLLDPTKCAIVALSYEWLGVGGVVMGFVIDNQIVPAHFFAHSNLVTDVYWRTPNLPMRWEVECAGAALPTATMKAICAAVISEGGAENIGLIRSDYRSSTVTAAGGATVELLSIRLRCGGTTDGLNAITSAIVLPENVSITNTTNDPGILCVGYNPTFTGAGTWANPIGAGGASSHVQVCKTGRVVTDPGHPLHLGSYSTALKADSSSFDKTTAIGCRPITGSGYGPSDVISLMYINPTGGNVSCFGTFGWREIT